MTNTTLVHDLILKEGMRVLRNNTAFVNTLQPQYDASYEAFGAAPGQSLRIMQPKEYSVRSGKNISVQNDEEKSVTLNKTVQRGVDLSFSSAELTQDITLLSKTKIQPAMATLASYMDHYCMDLAYKEVGNAVALPVTNLDKTDILNAGVLLDNFSAPRGSGRYCILNPQGQADLVGDLAALFNNSAKISSQYDDGVMGSNVLGFNFKMSQNVPTHTCGGYDANYDVKTAPANGATTLDVDTGSGTILEGDTFTIVGVNAVNPLTKQDTGKLMQFVVTADSAGGDVDLSISPGIYFEGQYQNVTAVPAVDADLVFTGTASGAYPQNIAFSNGFGAVGTAALDLPIGKGAEASRMVEDGISMRLVSQYDIKTDTIYYRFDILFGYVTVIPRHACRIFGV